MNNRKTQQPDTQSAMSEQASKRQLEADISVHIFSVSAALVGGLLSTLFLTLLALPSLYYVVVGRGQQRDDAFAPAVAM